MTKTELEQAITKTLKEITYYKTIWHETGDDTARKKLKELQILQLWHINQYEELMRCGEKESGYKPP